MKHQVYRSWLQQDQDLLWLEGHPGSGKSTLTKHTMEMISDDTSSKAAVFAHFFHGRGSDMQKSALGLLRSLAFQLIKTFPAYGKDFVRRYNEMDHSPWKPEWLYSALEKNLPTASRSRPIIMFIDALDECKDDRHDLRDFLARIVRGPVGANLKVFVSCRHYPNLFSEGYRVQTEVNNADDIAIFVSFKLQTMQEKKRSVLAKEIISNARGNFQWAHIVTTLSITLDDSGRTVASIQKNIRQLPPDIHKLYDSLLTHEDVEDLQLAHRLFHWLCFAKRPLSIREVQYAIILSPDTTERSKEEMCHRTDFREELDDMVKTITHVSRGLAEIVVYGNSVYSIHSWSSKVQLIHQTVRDYLLDTGLERIRRRKEKAGCHTEKVDHYIFRSCLRYVIMDDFVDQDRLYTSMRRSDLHPYILQFFEQHLVEFGSGVVDPSELIEILGWPFNRASLTNLAVALGMSLSTFDNELPISIFYRDRAPTKYFNLLHWSARKGLAGIVKSIVRKRFDQIQEEPHPGRTRSSTPPLSINAWEAQNRLIDGYYNVNVEDCSGWWSALRSAVVEGHAPVVRELMQSSVIDPNVQDPLGRTPLHDANHHWRGLRPKKDQHEIVKILLDHPRIDTTLQDQNGRTALFDALDANDMNILKMNISASNACMNMKDIFGNTPLSQAAMCGYVDAVELFISCGYYTGETLQHAYKVAQSKGYVAVQKAILSSESIRHEAHIGHAEPMKEDATFFRACGTIKTPLWKKSEEMCVDLAYVGLRTGDEEGCLNLMSVSSWMDNDKDDFGPLSVGSWMGSEENIDFLYASLWTRCDGSADFTHAPMLVDDLERSTDLSMICMPSTWSVDLEELSGTGSPSLTSTQPEPRPYKRKRSK